MGENENNIVNEEQNTIIEKQDIKVEENNLPENKDNTIIKQEKNNKSKKTIILLIVIIIILLLTVFGLVGYLVYQKNNNNIKKDDNTVEEENKTDDDILDNETIVQDKEESTIKKQLSVYRKEEDQYVIVKTEEPTDDIDKYKVYNITCKSDNCAFYEDEYVNNYSTDYILVNDQSKVVLYNYLKNERIEEFENIEFIGFGIAKEGLEIRTTDGKSGVYNYKLKKLTIPIQYDKIKVISYGGFQDTRGYSIDVILDDSIVVVEDGKEGIVNYQTGKVLLDTKYDEIKCYYSTQYDGLTNKTIQFPKQYCEVKKDNVINIYEYDYKTKKLSNLNYTVDLVYDIFDHYAYVKTATNNLDLIDLSTLQKITSFNMNESYKYHYATYYDNQVIMTMDKQDSTLPENEQCIEYSYNTITGESTTQDHICGGIGKPVLYLYPKEKTTVTVEFVHNNLLTTTYPKFTGKWQVTAYPNGDLYDKDGKYYYGLYWEEKLIKQAKFDEGFYVEKDDAITFLEEKLSMIGLNDRERNEFIMYWLPILEKNEKSLVYFELTEERESINKINITPKPDSLLRIVIHIKPVDKKISIKKQKLPSFNRKGFVAVEWGGHNYIKD